ncbi:hypothetical protein AB0J72_53045 [Dactylosporangium sp. NPDC049742]|uniref:hypothetical protein n=1 Tax=Dactylosporangium sp. NPDC049742 TaxID=3154737 RepID=UPI003435B36D
MTSRSRGLPLVSSRSTTVLTICPGNACDASQAASVVRTSSIAACATPTPKTRSASWRSSTALAWWCRRR